MPPNDRSEGVTLERVAKLRKIYVEGGIDALYREALSAAAERGDIRRREDEHGSQHPD